VCAHLVPTYVGGAQTTQSTRDLRSIRKQTLRGRREIWGKAPVSRALAVSVQRPDKLRSNRVGAFADAALYYDGKTVTIYGKRINMYASATAPNNLDQAIDFACERLELEALTCPRNNGLERGLPVS
jgi:hypothetical protein